jgi:hypothetical protein
MQFPLAIAQRLGRPAIPRQGAHPLWRLLLGFLFILDRQPAIDVPKLPLFSPDSLIGSNAGSGQCWAATLADVEQWMIRQQQAKS